MSPTENQPLRIGIMGAATIAQKNGAAIAHSSSDCVVVAIASRSEERAKSLAAELATDDSNNIVVYSGSSAYSDLLQSDTVDAVYLPLPTVPRKEWVLRALACGKHVLVEKPVAVSTKDYQEMIHAAHQHNRFLLDGTMFAHHGRMQLILEKCKQNELGKIQRIDSCFSFLGDESFFDNNIRCHKDMDPLGAIGDLGWYCVRFAVMVFGQVDNAAPTRVKVVDYTCNDQGVPMDATCLVKFEKNKKLFFHCSFTTILRQDVSIVGTEKCLVVDDFVLPTDPTPHVFTVRRQVKEGERTNRVMTRDYETVTCQEEPSQQVLMWKTFSHVGRQFAAAATRTEESYNNNNTQSWRGPRDSVQLANSHLEASITTQKVMDALMKSIAVGGVPIDVA